MEVCRAGVALQLPCFVTLTVDEPRRDGRVRVRCLVCSNGSSIAPPWDWPASGPGSFLDQVNQLSAAGFNQFVV